MPFSRYVIRKKGVVEVGSDPPDTRVMPTARCSKAPRAISAADLRRLQPA
jgi:hypothetical protein